MVRRVLMAVSAVLAVSLAGTAVAANDPNASAAGTSAVLQQLPGAAPVFVNCPSENTIPSTTASTAIACEIRAVQAGNVYHGALTAETDGGPWRVKDVFLSSPDPDSWRRCRTRGLRSLSSGQRPRKYKVHGLSCASTKLLVGDVTYKALTNSLRLPRHFTVAHYGTNTLGWQTFTFSCTGKTRVHQGPVNPYGVEKAVCFSAFGDGFLYKFEQGS